MIRHVVLLMLLAATFVIAGCGGGTDPINKGKDVPVKKDEKKD